MFSTDHPFENSIEAGEFMDKVPLDPAIKQAVNHDNAARPSQHA